MNKINKIFAVSAIALALSACNNGGDTLFNLEGGVTISGEELSSQTLTATVKDSNGFNESNVSYQWLADGVAIAGATSSSYILTDDELGSTITVSVNYTDDDNNDEAVISDATGVIEAIPVNTAGTVEITGDAKSGVELTATLTDENGLPTEGITYAWLAGGDSIGTESTVTLTNNEIGKTITVTVTYTDEDNFNESITSEATSEVTPENPNTVGTISITGTIASGAALTAEITDANGIPAEGVTYAWLATDSSGTATAIGDGTSTVILGATEIGKTITVSASYTDNDTYSESVISTATAAVTGEVSAPATFSGDLTAETNSKESEAITGTAIVTDTIASEEIFVAVTDFATLYGTFSITTTGAWTYTLDTANASVDILAPADADLTDSITLTSDDGTETQLVITIVPGAFVTTNAAKITDTVGATPLIPATGDDPEIPATSGTVGDLKVITSVLNSEGNVAIGDEATIGEIVAGKVSFSFNNNVGAFDPATELLLPVDNARVSLFGERNAASRALVELRFIHDGTIAIRDDAEQHLIDQTYVAGEWVDVEITWDASSATTSVAPIMNITIDGTPITSSDAALVITNGSYSSLSTHLQHVDTGMQNVQFKLGGTTGTVTDSAFFVDNLKVYSDLAATVIAFEDDFEQRAIGTLITNDVEASSPYILNLNNSATPEIENVLTDETEAAVNPI